MNGRILLLFSFFLILIGFIGDRRIETKKAMVSIESLRRHVGNMLSDRDPYKGYPGLERAAQYIKGEFLKA